MSAAAPPEQGSAQEPAPTATDGLGGEADAPQNVNNEPAVKFAISSLIADQVSRGVDPEGREGRAGGQDAQTGENQDAQNNEHNVPENTEAASEKALVEGQTDQTVAVNIELTANNEVKIDSTQETLTPQEIEPPMNKEIAANEQNEPNETSSEQPTSEDAQKETEPKNNDEVPIDNDAAPINNDMQAEPEPEKEDKTTSTISKSGSTVRTHATVYTPKQKSLAKTLNRKQFIALMKNEPSKSRPKTQMRARQLTSSVPLSKVPEYSEEAMKGKTIHITDPIALTEIIDDLMGKRVQALDTNDYITCHKIDEALTKIRANYRINDRQELYTTVITQLTQKKKSAEDDLTDAKLVWKQKWKDFEVKQKEEQNQLHEAHVKQHEDFEDYWRDPSNYIYFTKRSAIQLEHMNVERSLAMTGRFLEAEQFRKLNEKAEKSFSKEQASRLQTKFDQERERLIRCQEEDIKQLQFHQEADRKTLAEEERIEMDIKKRILENKIRNLEDEKQFQNFSAHTYKKPPSVVVPPTVTTKGGNDLPPMPAGRIFPRGVEDKVRINSKPQSRPLTLPSLRFKKFKVPNFGEKTKPKEDDEE